MRLRALFLTFLFTASLWSLPPAAAQSLGDIVVTEMMPDPSGSDSDREWFEVFNPTDAPIDLDGWTISDEGNSSHTIGEEVIVPAGGFALLCIKEDEAVNGGLACDYEYSNFTLVNSADEIILTAPNDTEVDRVEYGSGWPGPSEGVSMVFTGSSGADNNDPSNWAEADEREPKYPSDGGSDLGSPGTEGAQQNLTGTTVQFTAAGATVSETDGSVTLTVVLANPNGNEITADVVFESGFSSADVADLGGYTTATATFPASASDGATQDVTITLTDDAMTEGTETTVFALKNVTGGAEAGYPAEFSLVIEDNESAGPPALFISEVADPGDAGNAKFVELYNGTGQQINFDAENWYLSRQTNGGSSWYPERLTGAVDAGGVYVVGWKRTDFNNSYGFEADQYSTSVSGDGNDGYFLYRGGDHKSGTLVDAFGQIDEDGTGTDWYYKDSRAVRNTDVTAPNASFDALEWTIASAGTADMTPGEHPLSGRRMAGLKGWRMLAPAVEDLTVGDLAAQNLVQGVPGAYPGADVNLYTDYDESQDDWVPAQGTSEALPPGKGFIWYLFEEAPAPEFAPLPFTLRATGSSPAGKVEVSVPGGQAFHLLGNPYNASYDLSGLNLTEQGFSAVVQVWDPGVGGGVGSYVSLTQEPGTEDRVGPWQGFFIERSSGSATTLTFSINEKTSGGAFYGLTADMPRRKIGLRLTARDSDGQVLAHDEAATLYFHPEATADWDPWDASKLQPLSSSSATLAFEGERDGQVVRKAQESRPYDPADSFEVPLAFDAEGLSAGEAISFTIEWPHLENIPADWHVTLWDRKTDKEIDLQAESSYTFAREASSAQAQMQSEEALSSLATGPRTLQQQAAADEAPRFVLRFDGAALPVELASFEAQVREGRTVALAWKTLSEEANRGFAIERRVGAEDAFRQIGFVEGAGISQQAQDYRFEDSSLPYSARMLTYRLKQIDLGGQVAYSDTVAVTLASERFELLGNYPNPFRVATTLRYTLPEDEHVTVEIYDALGRRVTTLLDEEQRAGWKALRFEARGLSSGLYIYRITAGEVTRTRKMLLVR